MASTSNSMFHRGRSPQEIRFPRRWSRFIGLLKWKEFFTLIFYACMAISSLGGALFFGIRSLQGYRKGLIFFYLAMLLFMSVCSWICHFLLIKWRLDRFFYEFSRSKPPQLCTSSSGEGKVALDTYSATEATITACVHAGITSSEISSNRCFLCRLKAILKLFHAYAVFLAALVVSLLVLFDLSTGYTASHFRPTLFSVICLTTLQCWVVAVSFAWFINVLVFNDAAATGTEGEQTSECSGSSIGDFTRQASSPSGRRTRWSNSSSSGRGSRKYDDNSTGGSGERRPNRRGREGVSDDDDEDENKNNDAYYCGQPHQQLPRETEKRGTGDTSSSLWEMPSSEVSTCALATIRGVSSQWDGGDREEEEAEACGAEEEEVVDNSASVLQTQGDYRGVSIQPTVIGVPSFTVACMPTPTPLSSLRGGQARMAQGSSSTSVDHHHSSRV